MQKDFKDRLNSLDVQLTLDGVIYQLRRLSGNGCCCHHRERVRLTLEAMHGRPGLEQAITGSFQYLNAGYPQIYLELVSWLEEANKMGAVI